MANVNEGLSVGEEGGLDPNNSRDFEKIMEGRGVQKEAGEGEQPSTSIQDGLTTAEPGQAREPESGRFVASESKTPPAPASDTSQVPVVDEDPEVAAFLARYNGDHAAALKAAAGLTSVVGRQGQELGSTREELAELRGRLEQMSASQATPAAPVLSNDQVEEQAQELIGSDGYTAAATRAANQAHTTGDERLYQSIRELWALEQPGAAMDFNTDFRMWQRDERTKSAAAPAPEQWMLDAQESAQVRGIESALGASLDGFSQEDVAAISGQFEAAMSTMPKNVLAMVASSDPEARAAGVQLVVDRATLLASKAPAAAPVAAAAETQDPALPASVQKKLAGAAVATSALRPAAKSAATPENREDAIKEFKRQIVEAETTSVSSGLTYGDKR